MSAALNDVQLNLRPMAETDISGILEIEYAAYAFPWNRNIFKGCLRDDYCCRVVELDGEIAGYAIMSMGKDEAHLLNLCVDPGTTQDGAGRVFY